jgi:hypothetical protein
MFTPTSIPGLNEAQGLVDKGGFGYAAQVAAILIVLAVIALGFRYAYLQLKRMEAAINCGCGKHTSALGSQARTAEDLIRHPLFASLDLAILSAIPALPIPDPGRRQVFTDLLEIKFGTIRRVFKEWMRSHVHRVESMDDDALFYELIGLVNRTIEQYTLAFRAEGIPEPVIEAFNNWHSRRVKALEEELETICGSTWIGGPIGKVGFFFSILDNTSAGTLLDGERALRSLNGKLTGLIYKGVVIGPCKVGGYPTRG